MDATRMSLVVAVLLVGFASGYSQLMAPSAFETLLVKPLDMKQPQNTVMGQRLKDIGIEICPDQFHLCPATAECCQTESGDWNCCPKASSAPLSSGNGDNKPLVLKYFVNITLSDFMIY
ncbi:hypothetical protein AVEN_234564-1 [Araneus ventricosus]|uniref:Granulins domain-containing protein n=1 Tax=Araneus ventricosus TaxID=182803 RepID=A0A4Y2A9E3_ARAVE|nr:hypothetical protein AVEN_234564-1 [Araneus ventricosus]